MAEVDLAQIPDVDIDSEGVFKYVLIRVHARPPSGAEAGECKEIVRGYKWAEYHGDQDSSEATLSTPADIYDKVSGELQKKGYDCECLGGGRISHQSQDRKIHVYGYSMALGAVSTRVELRALTQRPPGSSRLTCGACGLPSCPQGGQNGLRSCPALHLD
ncbi:14 kDa phosphohistidine phosphatase isoform X2 [Castor canadensis]|uniref:14 kDa phosphohistidine phosphatase isoform X2 n=1 Tax=Castor canadensis TaxID=51338 RepID=A0AC58KVP0_CASCN